LKTVLLVAMPNSIHTARWISQCKSDQWRIHLFSSIPDEQLHPEMPAGHYLYMRTPFSFIGDCFQRLRLSWLGNILDWMGRHFEYSFPAYRAEQLARLIRSIKPDLIHSLEMQGAGYLVLDAKRLGKGRFPPWLITNWGSDLYLFGRLSAHRGRVKDLLLNADFYQCECMRDVDLARSLGFAGLVLPVQPNAGGFDLEKLKPIRSAVPTSNRHLIMLKGYQNWAGRALSGLAALERCADLLKGFTIVIYSASEDVKIAAELFSQKTGIPTQLLPAKLRHMEILTYHSHARLSIGLSISDGISTSLLEAMVMGSFPIQSCTACANEWISHGATGMVVPPDDPDRIAAVIRIALSDDSLVDQAAIANWAKALSHLDQDLLQQQAVSMYFNLLQ